VYVVVAFGFTEKFPPDAGTIAIAPGDVEPVVALVEVHDRFALAPRTIVCAVGDREHVGAGGTAY
jgi:hypothetical protein